MAEDKDFVLDDICKRLSLRSPQRESLERLAEAVEAAGFQKGADESALEGQLAAVRALFPHDQFPEVEFPPARDFDWKFLSFAFALATGVGKTRLMGAIIAYLYRVKGLRNFVVVAPGKTVYEKLIADFTEGSPKYVFKGLACFATKKPVIVTGDTYQGGAGMMDDPTLFGHSIAINIFNIQKLNERGDSHDDNQKDVAKIRRLNERIGQSYFDYLRSREDLVVLMDEAHHYRASEAAKTLGELQPVLGIEMTATPRAAGKRFGNILCEYGLAKAMADGFVKEPAVVRRENFRNDDYVNRQDELDRQKLQDAMLVHEATKTALSEYAFRNGVQKVKPFVLVVAPDTAYAGEIETYLKSTDFYGGRYAGSVIKVDYKARGSNDEAIAQLLDIERPENKVEIVIHVNMLSEGWDVTNLYTIVPLRAANSANLVEQTIGRGLRLPYGKRTGVLEIDTLSIVSHDKFDEIIAAARNMQITIRERTVPTVPKRTITAVPTVVSPLDGETANADGAPAAAPAEIAAQAAVRTIGGMVEADTTPQGVDLTSPAVREQVAATVTQTLAAAGTAPAPEDVEAGVSAALRMINAAMIEIPRITISPGDTSMRVHEFELDPGKVQYALRDDRLVYDFVTDRRVRDVRGQTGTGELAEDDIDGYVRKLVGEVAGFNDIDYDGNAQLVGKLCNDCIRHLAAKLSAEDMAICMRNNLRSLAESIHGQIREHATYDSGNDIVDVKPGNLILKANTLTLDADETPRPFDTSLAPGEKSRIRSMVFTGFGKCLFSLQKFDSDPERAFSELLERDSTVLKWFKPTLSNLRLYYGPNEYTPDFVFETTTGKFLCEVKAATEVNDPTVQAKKEAAVKWCCCANANAAGNGKPWNYLLIPDNCINSSMTLAQAIRDYAAADTLGEADDTANASEADIPLAAVFKEASPSTMTYSVSDVDSPADVPMAAEPPAPYTVTSSGK